MESIINLLNPRFAKLLPSKAYKITTEGEITEISPSNGEAFHLHEIQAHVEGYIEIVYLTDDRIMVVNEEGKFGKAYNDFATEVCNLHKAIGRGDFICGNAVICPTAMVP